MNKGIVIKKTRDLKEDLFWSFYDKGVIEWIDKNYMIENENYSYCVARENMKLVYDAIKCNVPFFIDLNRKNGNQDIENIFDIKLRDNIEWFELFEEIKRPVKLCKRSELANHLNNQTFFKSKEKGFHFKGIQDFIKKTCYDTYGKWCYPLEDRNIDIDDFFRNPLNYKEAIIDMLPPCEEFLVSSIIDFDFEKEIRVIYCGNEIVSAASKHDYKNEAKEDNFFIELGKKYGNKVPYLIWSVDFHPVRDGFDIVEAHFHCDLLGKFYGNQDFRKLFEITNKMLKL